MTFFQISVIVQFVRGVVLYTGDASVVFGDKLGVLPVSALWRMT